MWSLLGIALVIGASISQLNMGMHEDSLTMWATSIICIIGCVIIKAGKLFQDNWKEPAIGIAVIIIGGIGFCMSGWDAIDIPRLVFCLGGLVMFDTIWKQITE
ncbi:MAG: hypothetical protein ACI4AW_05065 [Paludibacteraceae bacterium]